MAAFAEMTREVSVTIQDKYWIDYYSQMCNEGPEWIDYSNERVHLQTLGTMIEASNRLVGRKVLDVGCGRGQLCKMASILGAAEVTGIDFVEESIARLSSEARDIRWLHGNFTDTNLRASL